VSAPAGNIQTEAETETTRGLVARSMDPTHNPSYPKRTHFLERAQLDEALRSCEERLASAGQKLTALGAHGDRELCARYFHQLQGARDQIAEAVRRLPLEAGELYHEDKERFQQAVAAFDRVWRKWESIGS
jgi:hypothetical protein